MPIALYYELNSKLFEKENAMTKYLKTFSGGSSSNTTTPTKTNKIDRNPPNIKPPGNKPGFFSRLGTSIKNGARSVGNFVGGVAGSAQSGFRAGKKSALGRSAK